MVTKQPIKEALCCSAITLFLQVNIDHFTIPKALATIMGQALRQFYQLGCLNLSIP